MARDYAKRQQPKRTRRTSDKRKPKKKSGSGVSIFFTGFATGVFASFLVYLSTLDSRPDPRPQAQVAAAETAGEKPVPKPRFDFYKLLPEQTIDVDVDPAPDVSKPRNDATGRDVYVLQAGSFRQREDADRRRAELLLLSLAPTVEEASGENGRWFRVYLGPFETRSAMARARSLTANQDIETLLLKREQP